MRIFLLSIIEFFGRTTRREKKKVNVVQTVSYLSMFHAAQMAPFHISGCHVTTTQSCYKIVQDITHRAGLMHPCNALLSHLRFPFLLNFKIRFT